jgi:RNA-directed DNA polymerase
MDGLIKMKRKNNLYLKNITLNKLYETYRDVKLSCRNKKKILEFSLYLNSNLLLIENLLMSGSYEFHKMNIFMIFEPKCRIVMSECIMDKVVNHFVAKNILLPAIEPCLIDTNVATRKNKGSSYADKLMFKYINKIGSNKKIYVLKLDMSKYFYNISHDYLKKLVRRRIKDRLSLSIIDKLIDSTDEDYVNDTIIKLKKTAIKNNYEVSKIPLYKKGYGLSIGSMCSQILAIYFLNDIDHFIKEVLKAKYYIRYMDDLVILSTDKIYLKNCFQKIEYLINEHVLKLNSKSNISLLNKGFTFLGYTYSLSNNKLLVQPRKVTLKRINKKLVRLKKQNYEKYFLSLISYQGYLRNKINLDRVFMDVTRIYYSYLIIYNDGIKLIILNNVMDVIKEKEIKKSYIKRILKYLKYNNTNYIYLKKNRLEINNIY